MVVCARCKKEMRCIKTGMTVRFREEGEHAYAGDMLECPECKATVAVTNSNSFYDEGAKRAAPFDVWMDADKGFKVEA
jgi:DNA-directed RNA polymerase subunit RPC12/RpoP